MDQRSPRNGRVIEELGWYDPCAKDPAQEANLNRERIDYWLSVGAQPSETVRDLLKRFPEGTPEQAATPAAKPQPAPRPETPKADEKPAEAPEPKAEEKPEDKPEPQASEASDEQPEPKPQAEADTDEQKSDQPGE
jgi:small subunit ribosomal protein S16